MSVTVLSRTYLCYIIELINVGHHYKYQYKGQLKTYRQSYRYCKYLCKYVPNDIPPGEIENSSQESGIML